MLCHEFLLWIPSVAWQSAWQGRVWCATCCHCYASSQASGNCLVITTGPRNWWKLLPASCFLSAACRWQDFVLLVVRTRGAHHPHHVINGEQIMPPHTGQPGHTPHGRQKLASLIWCNSQKSWTLIDYLVQSWTISYFVLNIFYFPPARNLQMHVCSYLHKLLINICVFLFQGKYLIQDEWRCFLCKITWHSKKSFHQKLEAG